MARKHALAAVAAEAGFESWPALKGSYAAPAPVHFDTTQLFQPATRGFLNRWFARYEQARSVLEVDPGCFLFPYRSQYFICEANFLESLGVNPRDPDWAAHRARLGAAGGPAGVGAALCKASRRCAQELPGRGVGAMFSRVCRALLLAAAVAWGQSYEAAPREVRQGETIHVRSAGPAASARMGERAIRLFPQSGGARLGLMPVPVDTRPGSYAVEFLAGDGSVLHSVTRRASSFRWVEESRSFLLWGFMGHVTDDYVSPERPWTENPEYDLVAFNPQTARWLSVYPLAKEKEWRTQLPPMHECNAYQGITIGSHRPQFKMREGVLRPDLNIVFDQLAYDSKRARMLYFTVAARSPTTCARVTGPGRRQPRDGPGLRHALRSCPHGAGQVRIRERRRTGFVWGRVPTSVRSDPKCRCPAPNPLRPSSGRISRRRTWHE